MQPSTPPCKLIRGSEMGCQVYSESGNHELIYSGATWCAVRLCGEYGLESKKARPWHSEPWYDRGVSAEDVRLANIHAPDSIDEEFSKDYSRDAYADAREFIRKCAEANEGFSVSY